MKIVLSFYSRNNRRLGIWSIATVADIKTYAFNKIILASIASIKCSMMVLPELEKIFQEMRYFFHLII